MSFEIIPVNPAPKMRLKIIADCYHPLAEKTFVDILYEIDNTWPTEDITPPPNVSVTGDLILGDKTGGDKITIGNISDSKGVAVGKSSSGSVAESISDQAQSKNDDHQIAQEKQEQAILESFFDSMTELLLDRRLRAKNSDNNEAIIARTRTLAVLRNLNGERKGQVIQFLYDAGLIEGKNPTINMSRADLVYVQLPTTSLENINLCAAKLQRADFSFANLKGADFSWVDLSKAKLSSDLRNVDLSNAFLNDTHLIAAKLQDSNLHRVQFNGADWSEFVRILELFRVAHSFYRLRG